ncbi:hypothetical protein NDU88_000807 [Pleurodeles waltl]|uniref:Secreted protein n=1 Tax=Pleurodeles waltl TaxID=8319 RepID=A0AAV7S819_PLEWA|nr:hypothetical protein NDU88_000807 [Pleurodeles waltl]
MSSPGKPGKGRRSQLSWAAPLLVVFFTSSLPGFCGSRLCLPFSSCVILSSLFLRIVFSFLFLRVVLSPSGTSRRLFCNGDLDIRIPEGRVFRFRPRSGGRHHW